MDETGPELDALQLDQFVDKAFQDGKWDDARIVLERLLSNMPAAWKPIFNDGDSRVCAFWDQSEFLSFANYQENKIGVQKTTFWAGLSYSKLWWHLARLNRKQGLLGAALTCIEKGLELEPDHPHLWIQKGFILGDSKQFAPALIAFQTAASVRAWASDSLIAWALRQQGYALIELGRLDEAEAVYRHSLELEPENKIAAHELQYIQRLSQPREEEAQKLSWFLRPLQSPPKDPVTRQLIELVDGMAPIDGPKTVGAKNYAVISRAFLDRGWDGFEEEFNRLYPPNRDDSLEIKRNLLREPIFLRKVHERMGRVALGKATVEEILEEISRTPAPPVKH